MALGADFLAAIGEAEPSKNTGIGDDFLIAIGEKPEAEEQKKPGLFGRIVGGIREGVTGKERTTPEIEAMGGIAEMPEVYNLDFLSTLSSVPAGTEETVKILKKNNPDMGVRQDEKGNYILKSVNGLEYAIKPGLEARDIGKGIATALMFGPAGKITNLGMRMLAAGATQLGIESAQKKSGGDFDAEQIPLAALTETIPDVAGAAKQRATAKVVSSIDDAAAPFIKSPAEEIAGSLTRKTAEEIPEQAEKVAPELIRQGYGVFSDDQLKKLGMEEIGKRVKTAVSSPLKKDRLKAVAEIAEQAEINPEILASAKTLGIEDYMQPDQLTTNQTYREISQAIKSIPGSKARQAQYEGLEKIAEKADDVIKQLGGTDDLSQLDYVIKKDLSETVDDLEVIADGLYKELKAEIVPRRLVQPENTINFINERAGDLGGLENLTAMEKKIFHRLKTKTATETPEFATGKKEIDKLPTYGLLDDTRNNVGAALEKNQGEFKDQEKGLLKALYANLIEDQRKIAEEQGASELFDLASLHVKTRKEVEKDFQSLYAKAIDKSIITPLTTSIKKLPEGDISGFIKTIKAIPKEKRQEAVASGLSIAMGKNAKNETIKFGDFATWYNNLSRNKRAYSALMSTLPPEAGKKLKALATVSDAINKTSKGYIATGRLQLAKETLQQSDKLINAIYGIALGTVRKTAGGGAVSAVAKSLVDSRSSIIELADDLLVSPAFTKALSATPEAKQQAIKKFVKTSTFKKFTNAIKTPGAAQEIIKTDPERWVSEILQSARQPRKENQNER